MATAATIQEPGSEQLRVPIDSVTELVKVLRTRLVSDPAERSDTEFVV